MLELSTRLRQLRSATRLRSLQHEQAEQALMLATKALQQAKNDLSTEVVRYRLLLGQHQHALKSGVSLDPGMLEQRLLALTTARRRVETCQKVVMDARQLHVHAKTALAEASLAMDVVLKASGRVQSQVAAHMRSREQIEIFESGSRRGGVS